MARAIEGPLGPVVGALLDVLGGFFGRVGLEVRASKLRHPARPYHVHLDRHRPVIGLIAHTLHEVMRLHDLDVRVREKKSSRSGRFRRAILAPLGALHRLLVDSFEDFELRTLIVSQTGGLAVLAYLPPPTAPLSVVAWEAMMALWRRGIIACAGFWLALEDARPGRRGEIRRLRSKFCRVH